MQKYSLLKDIYGHLCLDSNGEGYLVSDVEANIDDLITAKNGRIAGLEAALAEKDAKVIALVDEISIQDQMLNPGEHICEREINGVTICVLRKDLWDIRSTGEAKEAGEQIAALRHSLKIQRNEWERLNKHIDKQDEQIVELTTVSDGDPLHVLRKMTREQRLLFLRSLAICPDHFIKVDLILDTTGKLKDAAAKWLGKEE